MTAGRERCTLVSSFKDDLVQGVLGILAISSLFIKRHFERPQRPLHIWFLDASKQGFAALFQHGCNVLFAIWFAAGVGGNGDQCAFYFLNFTIQSVIGIIINYLLLRLLTSAAHKHEWTSLKEPGFYGPPPFFWAWFVQFLSWLTILGVTMFALAGLEYAIRDSLSEAGNFLFKPMLNYPYEELMLVMVLCPCLMNAVQFWIQDSFLKGTGSSTDDGGKPQGEDQTVKASCRAFGSGASNCGRSGVAKRLDFDSATSSEDDDADAVATHTLSIPLLDPVGSSQEEDGSYMSEHDRAIFEKFYGKNLSWKESLQVCHPNCLLLTCALPWSIRGTSN